MPAKIKLFVFLSKFFYINFYINFLAMPKQVKKGDLPQKICIVCGRPFAWRKKWEKVWAEVKYCSDRCRSFARRDAPL